jgi:plastocyanin
MYSERLGEMEESMRKLSGLLILIAAVVTVTCSRQPVAPAATGATTTGTDSQGGDPAALSATVKFGNEVGSPFPPPSGHDQSNHARDNLVPRNVVIKTGGTVTFVAPPSVHQIRIYKPGKDVDDVSFASPTTLAAFANCSGDPVVNAPLVITDPVLLEAAIPIPCFTPTTKTYTFRQPGKYLVICAFIPHLNVGMYGWVTVRD